MTMTGEQRCWAALDAMAKELDETAEKLIAMRRTFWHVVKAAGGVVEVPEEQLQQFAPADMVLVEERSFENGTVIVRAKVKSAKLQRLLRESEL